eukprot:GFYU01022280.1.p1 GENE.GFYU01022280.1~~GFYU01022280.1.p1  ORF type:complete len:156 (-),score=16.78 GFYU01022280.1:14-481(-)
MQTRVAVLVGITTLFLLANVYFLSSWSCEQRVAEAKIPLNTRISELESMNNKLSIELNKRTVTTSNVPSTPEPSVQNPPIVPVVPAPAPPEPATDPTGLRQGLRGGGHAPTPAEISPDLKTASFAQKPSLAPRKRTGVVIMAHARPKYLDRCLTS